MAQLPTQSQFGDYGDWPGRDVLDSGGERLGGVREIYLDRESGQPEWVLVDVADDEARFVPLADAEIAASTIRVAHTSETIRSAPGIGTEPRIDQSEERRLYDHYGIGYSTEESASGLPVEEEPTSSWSDAAETQEQAAVLAPPPGEPPSPEEIERAEHHDLPAASEPEPEPEPEPGPEPEAVSPSAAGPSAEPDVQDAPEPVPPPETELISPAATSEPPEIFSAPEPPVPPEPPKAPEPPKPPRSDWAPPPEPDSAGPLETIKNRKAGLIAGISIAAVLFLLIRRLR